LAKILLNKSNLFYNLDLCSTQAGGKDKVAIVLKDNAYGHGLEEISNLASEFGIKKAVVQDVFEANQVKDFFDEILILQASKNTIYSNKFHVTINNLSEIEQIPQNSNVHLKIDTGMHRNGISLNDIKIAISNIYNQDLNLTGVFTHYRSADTLSSEYFWQKSIFDNIKKEVISLSKQLNINIPKFHSANSNALFRNNNFDEDMCRVGLAAYGYLYQFDLSKNINLKPVLSLWADKISSRKIKKGQSVGYGGAFEASTDMQITTYDIGYGDGFLRLTQNQKFFTVDKEKLLGKVSMDNISVESSKETICIFDNVKYLSKLHNTIYYEILTSLKSNIFKEII
jgi:alanine racemase